jgi:four helix bundle protein
MEVTSYRDLKIWQRAITLSVECYRITEDMPKSETYGLTSQIRRASVSVAANIAEGYGRDSTGNYVQFLKVSQGSLKELETHFIIASRIGYLEFGKVEGLLESCDELGKMPRSYIRSIQASAT